MRVYEHLSEQRQHILSEYSNAHLIFKKRGELRANMKSRASRLIKNCFESTNTLNWTKILNNSHWNTIGLETSKWNTILTHMNQVNQVTSSAYVAMTIMKYRHYEIQKFISKFDKQSRIGGVSSPRIENYIVQVLIIFTSTLIYNKKKL